MTEVERIEAELTVLGRPKVAFSSFKATVSSLAACRAWDAAHPEAAARYVTLVEAHSRLVAAQESQEAEAKAAERALRRATTRLANSGAGERSLEAAAQPGPTPALEAVRAWMATPSAHWLVLAGGKGIGKTVAATWAVREAIRGGTTAAFRRHAEVLVLSDFDSGAAEWQRLKSVGLLVLDDVGVENLTPRGQAKTDELLDARHECLGRTILTTNLSWRLLAQRLGERVQDRIESDGPRAVLQLKASPSLRQKRTKEAA